LFKGLFNKNLDFSSKKSAVSSGNNSFNMKEHKLVCTTCQKKITNMTSVGAGMGPECRRKFNFILDIDRDKLEFMEDNKQPLSDKKFKTVKTGIVRTKVEEFPRFGTLVPAGAEKKFSFIDNVEIEKKLRAEKSLSEAIASSIYKLNTKDAVSIASIGVPKHPQLRKEYRKHQKEFKAQDKVKVESSNNSFYNNVSDRKNLSDHQREARKKLVLAQKEDSARYKILMKKGYFHRSTLLSRLYASELTEAHLLYKVLLRKHKNNIYFKDMKVEDYGLTDNEILNGFLHSKQSLERSLFKAFNKGSKNLKTMIDIYDKYDSLREEDQIECKKIMFNLIQNEDVDKEFLEKIGVK